MRRMEVLQGLRRMEFEGDLRALARAWPSQAEAAEILGMSERTFRRWRERYEADGAEGLIDRRRGGTRAGGCRSTGSSGCWRNTARATSTLRSSTSTSAAGGAWVRAGLQLDQARAAGRRLVKRCAQTRGTSQETAATAAAWHNAVPGRLGARVARGAVALDLIVTMDDATSEIYGGPGRGGGHVFRLRGLGGAIAKKAVLRALQRPGQPLFLHPQGWFGSRRSSSPRWAAPSRSWVSSTSLPTRRRRGAVWSGCSARWRSVCRRCCG